MADDGPDVERLAMLLHDRLYHGSWKGWDGLDDDERAEYRAAAAAVLADLTERHVFIPRKGAVQRREHEIRDEDAVTWHPVAMSAHLDPRVTFHHRYRTAVFGPWEESP